MVSVSVELNQGTSCVCECVCAVCSFDAGWGSSSQCELILRKDVNGDHVRLFVSHFHGV